MTIPATNLPEEIESPIKSFGSSKFFFHLYTTKKQKKEFFFPAKEL